MCRMRKCRGRRDAQERPSASLRQMFIFDTLRKILSEFYVDIYLYPVPALIIDQGITTGRGQRRCVFYPIHRVITNIDGGIFSGCNYFTINGFRISMKSAPALAASSVSVWLIRNAISVNCAASRPYYLEELLLHKNMIPGHLDWILFQVRYKFLDYYFVSIFHQGVQFITYCVASLSVNISPMATRVSLIVTASIPPLSPQCAHIMSFTSGWESDCSEMIVAYLMMLGPPPPNPKPMATCPLVPIRVPIPTPKVTLTFEEPLA